VEEDHDDQGEIDIDFIAGAYMGRKMYRTSTLGSGLFARLWLQRENGQLIIIEGAKVTTISAKGVKACASHGERACRLGCVLA